MIPDGFKLAAAAVVGRESCLEGPRFRLDGRSGENYVSVVTETVM